MSGLISRVFPVTELKAALMIVIACYAIFQFYELKSDLQMQRTISLESSREDQALVINKVTYPAPVKTETALTQFNIRSVSEFLLLDNGTTGDSFITSLMKLGLCILLEVMMWHLDFTDPFNPKNLKRFRWVCNFVIVLLFVSFLKNNYTGQWVTQTIGIQHTVDITYRYNFGYNNIYYIGLVWLVRVVISFYQKGVQNQQELELTI